MTNMAEDASSEKQAKPITDVEKPNTSAASATSKPVLVTNRPIMNDPMVKEDTSTEDGSSKEPKENLAAKGSSKVKIQPLESSPKPEEPVKTDEPNDSDEPSDTPEEAPTKPKVPQEKSESETAKKAGNAKTPVEDEDIEAARKAEHDANLQKIVDAKTYYLPINAVEKRKTKRFVLLGVALSILLILLWLDIALDAGLITLNGVSPLTHFFSS